MARHESRNRISMLGMSIDAIDAYLLIGLILGIALYATTKQVIFGYATLLVLAALFLRDAAPKKTDTKGITASIKELAIALGAAIAVWYGLGFLLQTPTPIDVVTSCSMLPALDRGDLIILQGGEIRAKEVELQEQIQFRDFVRTDCTIREISTGTGRKESCTTGLEANGGIYDFDKQGDIVVYEPENAFRDLGLVVHRVALKVNYEGETYYLIKGDNNPGPDVFGITQDLAKHEQIKGRMILRIPWLGYLKLLLSMQFEEPANCKYLIEY